MSTAHDGGIPQEDLRLGDELLPDTQGEDPLDADLGPEGQGDMLPEDEPSMPDPADPNAPMPPDVPAQPGVPVEPGMPVEPGVPTPQEPLAPNPDEPLAPTPEEPPLR